MNEHNNEIPQIVQFARSVETILSILIDAQQHDEANRESVPVEEALVLEEKIKSHK